MKTFLRWRLWEWFWLVFLVCLAARLLPRAGESLRTAAEAWHLWQDR